MSTGGRDGPARASPLLVGAEWFPDTPNGLNRYFRDLLEGLTDAGVDCAAIVVGPAEDPPSKLTVVRPGPLPLRMLRVARALAAVRSRGDVIDAHCAHYGIVAMVAARLTRRPLVVHFQGPWAGESAAAGGHSRLAIAVQRAIERALYRRATRLVVLSSAFERILLERYGVAPDRVVVDPPAVDLDRFAPGSRDDARDALGVPSSAFVAVTVRRLIPRMGLDDLLRAWARLDARDGLLLIAGSGPERGPLEELAAELGLGERVRFLGFVPEARLPDLYRAADVCVVPTRELEGFGLVALEALACGTPVLAADTDGLRDAVAGLGEDLLFPAGDHEALRDRLAGAADGARPLPAAEACRRHAEQFSIGRLVEYHLDLYDAVARARAGRG